MKTIKILSVFALAICLSGVAIAQQKTETIKVAGECGMCKKKIEKSAKEAGASYASWDVTTKLLTVKYNSTSTNAAKIQEKIAAVGYDTPDFKATDKAYNKLDGCCQYDRTASKAMMSCCGEKCEMKDGKCVDDAACKEKGCCADAEKCKDMGCCGHDGKDGAKGACCEKEMKTAKKNL